MFSKTIPLLLCLAGLACCSTLAVRTTERQERFFRSSVEGPNRLTSGVKSVTRVQIKPTPPYKISLDFPVRVTLKALGPDGQSSTVRAMIKRSKALLSVQVPFTATRKGKYSFRGQLSFGVCTDEACRPSSLTLQWTANLR